MRSRISMSDVVSTSRRLPIRLVYHAVPGFGKTSFGAQFPAPIFLYDAAETGLETLIDSGQLPETPHFPPVSTWDEVIEALGALTVETHNYQTLVIDTLGGLERLCHEHVCQKSFGGDWGEKGFAAYGRGPEQALAEWRGFLRSLDALREQRRVRIVALAHTRITRFANPEADDYDRYEPDLHRKTWALTARWSDLILFGNYQTATVIDGLRKKARGGVTRLLHTERSAAWEAKHRHGLAPVIRLGNTPEAAYGAFVDAMKAGAKAPASKPEPQEPQEQDAAVTIVAPDTTEGEE